MKSLLILRHASLQILRQPKAVAQIFLLPNAASFLLVHASGLAFLLSPIHVQVAISRGVMPWGQIAMVALAGTLLWLWSALAWHRFILLGEYPRYPWPPVTWAAVPRFLFTSLSVLVGGFLLIMAAGFLFGVVLGFASAATKQPPGWFAIGIGAVLALPVLIAVLRIALYLPHAAVSNGVGGSWIWHSTSGKFWTLLVVFSCLMALRFGVAFLLQRQGVTPFSTVGIVIVAGAELVQAVFSVSIITTLYGHYVEERPLV